MEIPNDFSELLESLNAHSVEYLIVGAYALAFHGSPRFTGDLDILVKPEVENAKRTIEALKDFGFESVDLTYEDFLSVDAVIELGYPPVRVDILTSLSGVSIEDAFNGKVEGKCGAVQTFYLDRRRLKENKRAAGRSQDLSDLRALENGDC